VLLSLLAVGVVAALGLTQSGCSKHADVWEGKGGPPRVVVSFAPLDSFVKAVGGDHVGVICLATTTGPHDYDYSEAEKVSVRHADLLLGIGLGLDDSFAPKLFNASGNSKLRFVKLGESLPAGMLRKAEDEDEKEKKDEKGKKDEKEEKGKDARHEHEHGEYDPHVWLGIDQAVKMVEKIRDELSDLDKTHKEEYARNAEAYIKTLNELKKQGREELKDKKDKRLISLHDSLEYFADTYGLEIVGVVEVLPGDEPDSAKRKELVDRCLKDKVKYIAIEEQYPSKAAEAIRDEVQSKAKKRADKDPSFKDYKIKLIKIDPLETAEKKDLGAGLYVETMKKNLKTLADNLE
jgi:ABC-type Zn uptake system ZnuABC Zn-binding protein ZnuA